MSENFDSYISSLQRQDKPAPTETASPQPSSSSRPEVIYLAKIADEVQLIRGRLTWIQLLLLFIVLILLSGFGIYLR